VKRLSFNKLQQNALIAVPARVNSLGKIIAGIVKYAETIVVCAVLFIGYAANAGLSSRTGC